MPCCPWLKPASPPLASVHRSRVRRPTLLRAEAPGTPAAAAALAVVAAAAVAEVAGRERRYPWTARRLARVAPRNGLADPPSERLGVHRSRGRKPVCRGAAGASGTAQAAGGHADSACCLAVVGERRGLLACCARSPGTHRRAARGPTGQRTRGLRAGGGS